MEKLGKILVVLAIAIAVIGVLLWIAGDKVRFLGRLPGDIRIERENFKLFIPITTMILISAVLSLLLWIIQKMSR